jgi:hypothetical protein
MRIYRNICIALRLPLLLTGCRDDVFGNNSVSTKAAVEAKSSCWLTPYFTIIEICKMLGPRPQAYLREVAKDK